jgi:hypothetical protein
MVVFLYALPRTCHSRPINRTQNRLDNKEGDKDDSRNQVRINPIRMKTRNIIDANVGGRPVDMVEFTYETADPKKWLLMFFGTGELGPADGSQLHEMDNYGYQKTPSFNPEWNILAPQAQKGYIEFDAAIIDWMKYQYGDDIQIVIAGHSLGAREVMDLVNHYRGIDKLPDNVVGFISVAGEMSGPYPDPAYAEDIPGFVFHGRSDTAISYWQSIKFVDSFKSILSRGERKNAPVLRIIDGQGHTSIMTYVYQPSREAEGYKAIKSLFRWDEYKPIECTAILDERNLEATFTLPTGESKRYRLVLE